MYVAEYRTIWLIAIFIASNRVFTEGICKLCDLIISDLIDEDFVKHDRKVIWKILIFHDNSFLQSTASSFVFGSAALLTKPGQTFAPLIGTLLLGSQTTTDDSTNHLLVLAMVPFVCALIQLALWSNYDLKGSKLAIIKSAVNKVHLV